METKSLSPLASSPVLICVHHSNEDLDTALSLTFNDQSTGTGLEEGGSSFFDLTGFGDSSYQIHINFILIIPITLNDLSFQTVQLRKRIFWIFQKAQLFFRKVICITLSLWVWAALKNFSMKSNWDFSSSSSIRRSLVIGPFSVAFSTLMCGTSPSVYL